ncbi:MAG: hypothetical protein ACLGI9_09695 [Thermoanaerobaculia bacterium]
MLPRQGRLARPRRIGLDAVPERDVLMPPIRRWLALSLLLLTLAPALSWAGPRRPEPREETVMGSFLTTLWTFVKALWEAEGGSLDPSGEPRPTNGSSLDPNGSTADNGGSLDPAG